MNISKIRWFDIFCYKGSLLYFLMIGVCLVFTSILGTLVPQWTVELSKAYGDIASFHEMIWKMLSLFVGIYFIHVFFELVINIYMRDLLQKMRTYCYECWIENHDHEDNREKYPLGEVLARIINDTEAVRDLATARSFGIIVDVFFILSIFISFMLINRNTAVFIFAIEILALLLLIWGSKKMRGIFLLVRNSRGRLSRTLANILGGTADTYFGSHHNYASKKGDVAAKDFLEKQLKANAWDASYFSVAESLYPIVLAALIIFFPYSRIIEVAVVFATIDIIQRSINPIKSIANKIAGIQRAMTGIIRISEFLTDLGEDKENEREKYIKNFEKLSISIGSFYYTNNRDFSLNKISFDGAKGELIGIVGTSGCGKSTILKIVAGNIIPEDFLLTLSGTDESLDYCKASQGKDFRKHVSLISQDSHIFSESLAFNITLKHYIPEDFSKFWEWMVLMIPYLSEWGISRDDIVIPIKLSTGQKQLISAIRSCYLTKPVVLFDEIASSLDSKLEQAIRKVILLIQEKSLTIIVAHRIETIIGADKIIVIEEGSQIAMGSHQFLLNSSQIYSRFIEEISSRE